MRTAFAPSALLIIAGCDSDDGQETVKAPEMAEKPITDLGPLIVVEKREKATG